MMELIAEGKGCRLYHGDSTEYMGDADLVLTNPYASLPTQFRTTPMILSAQLERKDLMQEIADAPLTEIGRWHRGTQAVWVANLEPKPIELDFLAPEEVEKMRGFWPLDLPVRLLEHHGYDCRSARDFDPILTPIVWDGFMGRGTVGKACQLLGLQFVGIDKDIERVKLAQRYLGLA